jgi:ppGpp synthetase/RelA/SpoT-type nucleotidyltranferase
MNLEFDLADASQIAQEYRRRHPLLRELASRLEGFAKGLLVGIEHIDRIYFRAKDVESFAKKSMSVEASGERRYAFPHEDIEDQVAGRVLVFFRRDIAVVANTLRERFNPAEQIRKAPSEHDAFAYESEHLVFIIPPDAFPTGWDRLEGPPTTFELQVRTLFMHAWAEPEHDISYKAKIPLTNEEKRKLAWAASNAWGGDAIFEQVLDSLAARISTPIDGDPE